MKYTKHDPKNMLAFRCHAPLKDALSLVAKHNKLSRSSVIRILLIQALKQNADTLIPPSRKKSKKAVDTKPTARHA